MKMIGIDVGGTFSDLVYADPGSGALAVHKWRVYGIPRVSA